MILYLFIALGLSAEGYFCPSLSLIADSLGVKFLNLNTFLFYFILFYFN